MDAYEDWYGAPGPMRMRGRGRTQMMGPPRGSMRGGPGPFGSRGGGMMTSRGFGGPMGPMGPMGPRPFGNTVEANDPKFLKQCKRYLESIKKNIPTNKDNLSAYCAACSYMAKNNQEFFNHRDTAKHLNQMSKIQMMPEEIRLQVKDVINDVHVQRSAQKVLMYCDLCEEKLPVPYSDHKNQVAHQLRSKAVRAGCIPCKTGPLKSYPAYKEHCQTEEHVEKSEIFQKELEQKIATCTAPKDFPPFQEGVLFGTEHVKLTDGYYCTLCRKYLHDEEEMEVHAKLQRHFNHVRDEFFDNRKIEEIDMGDYTLLGDEEEEQEAADDQANGDSGDKTEEAMETKSEEEMETS